MEAPHISTHVLDTSRGKAVAELPISLYYRTVDNGWIFISESKTTLNGRCADLLGATGQSLRAGQYKLVFHVENYFTQAETPALYPLVEVIVDIQHPNESYHLPLLLNPFGYSTYRGT